MKQILFILISIAFLQAPINTCLGNTPATYGHECMATPDADSMQQKKKGTEDEIKTESLFYTFITEDVAKHKKTKKEGDVFYYAVFKDTNKAFDAILNFIAPPTKRTYFGKTYEYESELIKVKWVENTADKKSVEGGFAQIQVNFKKNNQAYTVIFCK